MLARRNERLQQDINTHKEQRTFYLTDRENMMRQRDQLAKGYDEIRKYNSELQKSRDEAVNKQLEVSTLLGENNFFSARRVIKICILLFSTSLMTGIN